MRFVLESGKSLVGLRREIEVPHISVVVPVYNAEQTIERCVNSICNQTFSDLEVILVDDGSTDGSGNLCDALASCDQRIKVIHKENQGVSVARNSGMEMATGKYLLFVDSDDYIPLDYYQSMVETKTRLGEDIFVWTALKVVSENRSIAEQKFYYGDEDCSLLTRKDVLKLSMRCLINSPVNKLYLLEVIKKHGILMDASISIAEDLLFNLQYMDAVGYCKIAVLNNVTYFYVRNGQVSLDHGYRKGYYETHQRVLNQLWDYAKKWNSPEEDEPLYFSRYWEYMQSAIDNNESPHSGLSWLAKIKENSKVIRDEKFQKCLEYRKDTMGKGTYLSYKTKSYFFVWLYYMVRRK